MVSHNNDTFRELLPTNIDLFRAHIKQYSHLLPSSSKDFFESFNDRLNRQKIIKQKIFKSKCETLAHTHEADNVAINYSWAYMIRHWWLNGKKWLSPLVPKRKLSLPSIQKSSRNLKSSQPLATRHDKKLAPNKKIFVGRGSTYHGK